VAKEVLLEVTSTQSYAEGSTDSIEYRVLGTLHKRGDILYLVYPEPETTGIVGVTTSLKIEPHKVTLNRMGTLEHKQVFERGMFHSSTYVTPQACFSFQVYTEDMEINLTEQEGKLTLKYSLFSDKHLISKNILRINIKEDAPQ